MCFQGEATRTAQFVDVCVLPVGSRQAEIIVLNASGQHVRRHEQSAVGLNRIATTLRGLLPQI